MWRNYMDRPIQSTPHLNYQKQFSWLVLVTTSIIGRRMQVRSIPPGAGRKHGQDLMPPGPAARSAGVRLLLLEASLCRDIQADDWEREWSIRSWFHAHLLNSRALCQREYEVQTQVAGSLIILPRLCDM